MWEALRAHGGAAAVSVFSFGLALAAADVTRAQAGNGGIRGHFGHGPHFTARLTNADTVPLVPDRGFSGRAKAWFVLQRGELKLKYRIKSDMDLNAGFPQTPSDEDDVTQIHLHSAPPGVAGPHVLNVYKEPAQDDDDLVVRPNQGIVEGLWDDDDLSDGLPEGPDSEPVSEFIAELCDGEVYVNVHGTGDQDTGALRGNLEATRKGRRICRAIERLDDEEDD